MTASRAAARERLDTGLRRDRWGWEAYVKIHGQQFSKRFPADTPLNTMRLWRSQKRAEATGVLRGRIPKSFSAIKPLRRSKDGWCYVYFIQDGDVIKIGRAVHPMERLQNLQTGHSNPLRLIAAIPTHASLEAAIHQRFAHLRSSNGEWFHLGPDLEFFIEQVREGKNPVPLIW